MTLPHVDLETGQIYGCEPHSWHFYHEEGHLEFNKKNSTSNLLMLQQYAFYLWMLSISIRLLWMTIFFLGAYLGIMIYEEVWCNRYANQKYIKYIQSKTKHLNTTNT